MARANQTETARTAADDQETETATPGRKPRRIVVEVRKSYTLYDGDYIELASFVDDYKEGVYEEHEEMFRELMGDIFPEEEKEEEADQ